MKVSTINLKNEDVTLTAYIQDKSPEIAHYDIRPAVLVLPGGGYFMCSDREAEPIALAFLSKGYNAFILRYSVGKNKGDFPKPLNDADEAMELIYKNAADWNIDPNKIAAIGFSAGGHLCAALSTMGKIKPNATILLYPCILESTSKVLVSNVPSLDEVVTSETPPAFIAATFEDNTVPVANSLAYASALDRAGVPFEMHIFEKGGHGFSLANDTVYGKKEDIEHNGHLDVWFEMCIKWLDEKLK